MEDWETSDESVNNGSNPFREDFQRIHLFREASPVITINQYKEGTVNYSLVKEDDDSTSRSSISDDITAAASQMTERRDQRETTLSHYDEVHDSFGAKEPTSDSATTRIITGPEMFYLSQEIIRRLRHLTTAAIESLGGKRATLVMDAITKAGLKVLAEMETHPIIPSEPMTDGRKELIYVKEQRKAIANRQNLQKWVEANHQEEVNFRRDLERIHPTMDHRRFINKRWNHEDWAPPTTTRRPNQ